MTNKSITSALALGLIAFTGERMVSRETLSAPFKLLARAVAAVAIAVFWCITTVTNIVAVTFVVTSVATAVNAVTSTPAKAQRGSRRGVGGGEQMPPPEDTPSVDQPPAGSEEKPGKQIGKRAACESKGHQYNSETGRCTKSIETKPVSAGFKLFRQPMSPGSNGRQS